tara:strand:- start:113 stop:511 length:399 start_codon:yes stop_codon:yes gene_type:complete
MPDLDNNLDSFKAAVDDIVDDVQISSETEEEVVKTKKEKHEFSTPFMLGTILTLSALTYFFSIIGLSTFAILIGFLLGLVVLSTPFTALEDGMALLERRKGLSKRTKAYVYIFFFTALGLGLSIFLYFGSYF